MNFPKIDTDRSAIPDGDTTRLVLADIGTIETYVDEMDWWTRLPVRVAHGTVTGVVIELGPYTLEASDVEHLRRAIQAYDLANGGFDHHGGHK